MLARCWRTSAMLMENGIWRAGCIRQTRGQREGLGALGCTRRGRSTHQYRSRSVRPGQLSRRRALESLAGCLERGAASGSDSRVKLVIRHAGSFLTERHQAPESAPAPGRKIKPKSQTGYPTRIETVVSGYLENRERWGWAAPGAISHGRARIISLFSPPFLTF